MIPDIALAAVTAIAPFVAKGLEKISESVGNDLWELIKSPFSDKKDKHILEEFKKNPSNERIQGQVEYVLNNSINEDPAYRKKFEAAFEKFSAISQNFRDINMTHYGTGDNVGGNKIINENYRK